MCASKGGQQTGTCIALGLNGIIQVGVKGQCNSDLQGDASEEIDVTADTIIRFTELRKPSQ